MIAADLGRFETVLALIEHFEKRKKAQAKDESDESMEGSDEYDEEGDEEAEEPEGRFDVDYINFKDRSSRTALQYASYSGHLEIVKALVEAGAEIDTKNSKQIVREL
jgi:ankyrin repeat protein